MVGPEDDGLRFYSLTFFYPNNMATKEFKTFKSIVLKHLLYIEQKIKNAISIQVSEKYGIDQKSYLKRSNYDKTNAYLDENLDKIKQQAKSLAIRMSR